MTIIPFITLRADRLIVLALALSTAAFAETARVEPGTAVVPTQTEVGSDLNDSAHQDIPKDSGFVRVFNFASGYKDRVAILLGKGKLGDPASASGLGSLLRGSRSPDIRDYEAFPPGQYQLLIRKEDTTDFSGATDVITAYQPGQELAPPVDITVAPKSSISVFVWTEGNQVKAQAIADDTRSVRICNFTSASPITFTAGQGDTPATLVKNPPQGISALSGTLSGSDSLFSLIYPSPSGAPAKKTAEVAFGSSQGVTLVSYLDKYGRVAFRGFANAAPPPPAP